MQRLFTRVASAIATAAGQPTVFLLAVLIVVVWGVTGPLFHYSDTWQLVINTGTTIITFLMVFLIQNSQNRDGAAMQAKLDEMLRAIREARSEFIGIEHLTEAQLILLKNKLEELAGDELAHQQSIERLIHRR